MDLQEAEKITMPAKPWRKGFRFFSKGLQLDKNPYANAKRKAQFEAGWHDAQEVRDWDATISDGIE